MSTNTIENFKNQFLTLTYDTIDGLADVYHPEIYFKDPLHEWRGWEQLSKYFKHQYKYTNYAKFDYKDTFVNEKTASIIWTMEFSHKALASGKPIFVDGASYLKLEDERVIQHIDYFDTNEFLYNNIPVVSVFSKAMQKIPGWGLKRAGITN